MAVTNAIFYVDYGGVELIPISYADNGSGLIRVTTTFNSPDTNELVTITGTTSSVYNGLWKITKISAFVFDLQGSVFTVNPATKGSCIHGGSDVSRIGCAPTSYDNNGSSIVRVTVPSNGMNANSMTTDSVVSITGTSVTAYNDKWKITVIDSTHFDLQGCAYTSNPATKGFATPLGGGSWLDAFKTIGGTATSINSKGTAPVLRVAKTPEPTPIGSCVWTYKSPTVTIPAGLVASVYDSGAWTAAVATGSSITTTPASKVGSLAAMITCSTSPSLNTLQAYVTVGGGSGLDLSAFEQLSFWFRSSSDANLAGNWKLCLCSDTAGAVVVNSFPVPAAVGLTYFFPSTIDNGAPLGSAIKSVALYSDTVLANANSVVIISQIIACKASSSPNSISLTSFISTHNGSGTDPFFAIQSITGTTLVVDVVTNTNAGDPNRGWSGSSGTFTTYKRETTKTIMIYGSGAAAQNVYDGGSAGSPVLYSGGWDKTTTTQSAWSQTHFDGRNNQGCAVDLNTGKTFLSFERMSFSRYYSGFTWNSYPTGPADLGHNLSLIDMSHLMWNAVNFINQITFGTVSIVNLCNVGVFSSGGRCTLSIFNFVSNQTTLNTCSNSTCTIVNCRNNGAGPAVYAGEKSILLMTSCVDNVGVGVGPGTDSIVIGASFNNNAVASMGSSVMRSFASNCAFLDSTEVPASSTSYFMQYMNRRLISKDHDKTPGFNRIFTDGGLIETNTATVHTSGGKSWKLMPTSTHRVSNYPLDLLIATVAVVANTSVVVTAWVYRDNAGITAYLSCPNNQPAGGPATTQVSPSASATGSWEKLTLSWSPTTAGVAEVYFNAYGGTTYAAYIDDIQVSQ